MLRRIGRFLVGRQRRKASRVGRSFRRHTLDLVRHPIRTLVGTTLMTGLFLFLFLLATNAAGLQAVAAQESVSVGDVFGLFPHPLLVVPIVAGTVVVVLVATVVTNVKNDFRYRN